MTALPPDFALLQVVPELETGGAEQTAIDIAQAVVRAGGKAFVASRGGRMAARLEADGGRLAQMPAQSKNPLVMLGNTARLIDLIRRENITLVHARSRAPAFSALWAAHATKVPFVATYHGIYNARSGLKRWYNAVMTRGDLVIANSDYTRDHVIAEHEVDPARIVSIPRGVDLTRFDPRKVTAARVQALRDLWNLPKKDERTVFVLGGRITRLKGHATIVEAAARLKAGQDGTGGREDFLILFVGDDQGRTEYRQEIEDAIAAAGLTDQVRLVGHCDDMPAAYRLADVALLPSTQPESFGRAAVEPQAMARPVLVSDHGGGRETVVDGETGWRLPPGDAQAWARGLAVAMDTDSAARRAMGEAGLARARRLYSVEAMCEATLAVYARILESRA
ncbi:MAG TPA: glycosyltransferase family 4 protein [Caulobacter sp.]|nr:glycosyltransferase family 4 protein [Caulobacter sp.]